MPFDIHTVEVVDGSNNTFPDKVVVAILSGVANLAGGGAGTAVTTAVAFVNQELPPTYNVQVTPNQAAMASVTAKTANGFNVTLTPLATITLAAGTFDVLVTA